MVSFDYIQGRAPEHKTGKMSIQNLAGVPNSAHLGRFHEEMYEGLNHSSCIMFNTCQERNVQSYKPTHQGKRNVNREYQPSRTFNMDLKEYK